MKKQIALCLCLVTAGCASTSVTQVSQNQFILSTSAAPACGATGSQRVASKMAAVETLRRGYQRYMIAGMQAQNNVSVVTTPVTGSYTTGTVNTVGNTSYGTFNTTYTGGDTIVSGSRDTQLGVVMFNPGDAGFSNALDARAQLGENWQELVETGINNCSQV